MSAEPWHLIGPQRGLLPVCLPEWDPATDISLSRTLRLDVAAIWGACSLAADDALLIVAEWTSEGTNLKGYVRSEPISFSTEAIVNLVLDIKGKNLAHAVVVRCRLVLLPGSYPRESPLAPSLHGSVLWNDEHRLVLEGEGSRFPMEQIDFASLPGIPLGASWHLDWSPLDPEMPLSAAMRLYLNSRHVHVIQAVAASEPTEEQLMLRKTILWDVARQLVVGMLDNPDFTVGGHGEGTLGRAVSVMLQIHIPGETASGLRSLKESRPAVFESVLQSAFHPYPGVSA